MLSTICNASPSWEIDQYVSSFKAIGLCLQVKNFMVLKRYALLEVPTIK